MTDERSLHFAGTTAIDQPTIPDWFADDRDIDAANAPTFGETFRSLITAQDSGVAWEVPPGAVPETESVSEMNTHAPDGIEFRVAHSADDPEERVVYATTESHNAVFSPELVQRMLGGEDVDPLLNIPTDSYALVNPYDFYRPLEDALEAGGEGDNIFGEFRVYDRGAEVHGDLWFDTKNIDLPYGEGMFKFGIQSGYDFRGQRALYANIIAQDTSCSNTLRQLASKKTRRHVSGEDEAEMNPAEYQAWWEELLDTIDLVSDELSHVLQDAQEIDVEFDVASDDDPDVGEYDVRVPFGLSEFYRLAGAAHVGRDLPEYLRDAATQDCRGRSPGDVSHSLWHIHSGLTYALTHVFRGGERGSLLQYNRVAKDMLYNPHELLEEMAQEYEREQTEEGDLDIIGERGIATIRESADSLDNMREEFEGRQQRLETMLEDDVEA